MPYLAAVSHSGLNTPNTSHLMIIFSEVPLGFPIGQRAYRTEYHVHKIYHPLHHHNEIFHLFSPLTHNFVAERVLLNEGKKMRSSCLMATERPGMAVAAQAEMD